MKTIQVDCTESLRNSFEMGDSIRSMREILNNHDKSFVEFMDMSIEDKSKFMLEKLSTTEFCILESHYQKLVDKGLIAW